MTRAIILPRAKKVKCASKQGFAKEQQEMLS
jgi:hypothetical protein